MAIGKKTTKNKEPINIAKHLKSKNKQNGLAPSDTKTYSNTIVIQTEWYQHSDNYEFPPFIFEVYFLSRDYPRNYLL